MCLWRSWILLSSSPQGSFHQSWPRHSLNLKPISAHLQSDTLLRDPCIMVSVGFDNGRVAAFTCPFFPFFPVAVVFCILLDTENIFLCYSSRTIPNTQRYPHKENFYWLQVVLVIWHGFQWSQKVPSECWTFQNSTEKKRDCQRKNTLPTVSPSQLYQDQFLNFHRT